jgi:hypothetical protein
LIKSSMFIQPPGHVPLRRTLFPLPSTMYRPLSPRNSILFSASTLSISNGLLVCSASAEADVPASAAAPVSAASLRNSRRGRSSAALFKIGPLSTIRFYKCRMWSSDRHTLRAKLVRKPVSTGTQRNAGNSRGRFRPYGEERLCLGGNALIAIREREFNRHAGVDRKWSVNSCDQAEALIDPF